MFTEVVKLSERGQRHYSHHNDVFGFDSSSAILKIEWRVAGQVLTAHVQRFFRPVTGVTLFALVLHLNCIALSQSKSSNFFMYIVISNIHQLNTDIR